MNLESNITADQLDHVGCPMPQELRDPEYRTGEAVREVVKTIEIHGLLSNPSIHHRNLGEWAIEAYWPNMNMLEAQLLILGLTELDDIYGTFNVEKPN